MADVDLTCGKCGHQMKISEYVSDDTVPCPSCRESVDVVRVDRSIAMSFKAGETQAGRPVLSEETMPVEQGDESNVVIPPSDGPADVLDNVHKARAKTKSPKAWLGIISFIFVGGLLVGLQHLCQSSGDLLERYQQMRMVVGPAIYIAVLISAVQDGYLQGILCFFIPPYILFYALSRLESAMLAGAVIALMVAMATEVYYMPSESVLLASQEWLLVFIDDVGGLLERASDTPNALDIK